MAYIYLGWLDSPYGKILEKAFENETKAKAWLFDVAKERDAKVEPQGMVAVADKGDGLYIWHVTTKEIE